MNGFHRISELSPQVLANVVKRGDRLQNGWHERRARTHTTVQDDPSAERGVDRLAVPDHVQIHAVLYEDGESDLLGRPQQRVRRGMAFGRRLGDLEVPSRV